MPTDEEITATIERYSSTFEEGTHVELAFFGGNFTGIPMSEQQRLFDLVRPYCQRIGVQGIRLSTRPDYISDEKVDFLKANGVTTVELGVQSLDDEVLARIRRGYTAETVERAAAIIQKRDIEVGMQMMLGLPGDTAEKAQRTARRIIELGATNTRIYPTLVVARTLLARWYDQGLYTPLTLQEAVNQCKDILYLFETNNITVLRVGLHPTEGFISHTDYLAGPFHVAFKELVQTEIWHDIFAKTEIHGGEVVITVPEQQLNAAVGHHAKNKKMLLQRCKSVKFNTSTELKPYKFEIES
jgi:histone acetyltransferase (RNA polymerase elongator complex component)